ncbi:hypothetical protein HNP55_000917 [Paucibacter oligotrophus]|uniref:Phytanoyl-CoA dioxygenase PhyH n=1 Tax=Roseateles oligotrophus TaxID=1769250 RepID=A0A840L6V7_9BURK|nr:hypothetical protein [Roseateles oligotrophus]MBB4842422.1 hypothetical protein [Roseateles oligotrophus]
MSIKSKLKHALTVSRDPRWWPFYLQRRFMQPQRRSWLAQQIARVRPPAGAFHRSDPLHLRHTTEIAEQGITHLPPPLSPSQCMELITYFSAKDVYDPYRTEIAPFKPQGQGRHSHSHVAHHYPEDIVQAPYLLALANDPAILSIVEKFLGCKPSLAYMATWWSYATSLGAQQAEFFHRDVDDWRFIKLFVYLTDVDAESGPHVYVSQSSQDPTLTTIRRFSDDEIAKNFKPEQIRVLTGKAGDAFLEDTFGIHKGQPVQRGQRLLFQAVYSMCALPYGPTKPVASHAEIQRKLPQLGLDPWVNRFYLEA